MIDEIFKLCFVSTLMSIAVYITACREQPGGRKVDEEETKL